MTELFETTIVNAPMETIWNVLFSDEFAADMAPTSDYTTTVCPGTSNKPYMQPLLHHSFALRYPFDQDAAIYETNKMIAVWLAGIAASVEMARFRFELQPIGSSTIVLSTLLHMQRSLEQTGSAQKQVKKTDIRKFLHALLKCLKCQAEKERRGVTFRQTKVADF